jgi:HEAT repeat protein
VAALIDQFTSGSYEAQVLAVFALRDIGTPAAGAALARAKEHPSDPRLVQVIDFATGAAKREH